MKKSRRLTAKLLRELLHYDPETGEFIRLVRTCNAVKVGERAGCINNLGYHQIRVTHMHYGHRLAWLYMTGEWPRNEVDHIDGNRANNAWANLRDVPKHANLQNQTKLRKNNKTGFLGVMAWKDKFRAQITANRRFYFLGTFATAEAAHAAYLKAKKKLHVGCV